MLAVLRCYFLGIGWVAGARTQDSALLAQRLWHTAGAMLADLDAGRRHLIEGIEAHVEFRPKAWRGTKP